MDNRKFKGTVLIEKLDAITYELKETLPLEENDFNISTLINYYMNDGSLSLPPQRGVTTASDKYWWLFWSQSEINQSYLNPTIPTESLNGELIGSYVACNLGSPFLTTKSLPTEKDYLTFIADIIPGASTRTIRSLALGHNSTGGALFNLPNTNIPFTNLNLTTPCIQDNLTVIRVTYRLYYDDPIRNTNYSEFSDAPYYYFIDGLQTISNGSLNGNTLKVIYSANVYLTSSFYNPDNIDNYKYTLFHNNNEAKIFSDGAYSRTISKTWYHDNLTFLISDSLTSVTTMGCFFRTINIFGGNTSDVSLLKYVYGSGGSNTYNIGYPYMYKTILPNTTTPVKNVFKQTSLANTPFQDLSTIGTMTGSIAINSTNWNIQSFPKIVRLNITNSGDNTSATYKYEVGTFSGGFMENTFSPRSVIFPQDGFFIGDVSYHRKHVQDNNILEQVTSGGTIIRSPDNSKYFVAVNCQRNKDSISYYNIETGNKYILNSSTTPSLPVTNTSDMAVSNGYTFVTCANTGLWKISPDFTTVTNFNTIGGSIDATKAYQIDVKENGDLWVLFEGGLAKGVTPDNGLNWNWTVYDTTTSPIFSASGITNSNWSNVTAMCVDPVHTNDRILFVLGSAATTNNNAAGFIWWERLTGTTTIMTNGVPYPTFNLANNLQRSDILRCANGIWFTSDVSETVGGNPATATIYKTSYSNTSWSTNAITGYDGRIIPAKINNIKSVFIGSIGSINAANVNRYSAIVVKESSLSSLPSTITISMSQKEFSLLNGSSATVNNYSANSVIHNASTPVLYLENSNMVVCFCPISKLFYFLPLIPPSTATNYNDYKGAFWKEYGWNGSSWVLNNSNSKTCHSTFDTFFDGLTISFTNGVSGTSFVNTEKFTFVVGNGIMKDNATQLDLKFSVSPWTTESISDLYHPINGQITTVPDTIYGNRIDELVCFSPKLPSATNEKMSMIATKGTIRRLAHVDSEYISSEEIPANTEFTLKFKINSTHVVTSSTAVLVTTLGFTTNGSANIITIHHNTTNGNLEIKDGEYTGSALGSIPRNLLSIDKEFVITRLKNNLIVFMYDNIIYAAKLSSAKFYIDCQNNTSGTPIFLGYTDIKLSYTDFRRMALFGNQTTQTSKFNNKFMHTYVNNFLSNLKCTINNIPQTILFTPSYASTLAANQVRYETGSGYLVFRDMPTITVSTSGSTTSPALYPIITSGVITNIVIHKNGSGYTSTPTITISAPESGTTATATVTLAATNSVNDLVTITNAGSGYTPGIYPLSITGGGGSGATGNVYISTTGVVVAIDITNGGSNYTSTPTLSFSGAGTPTVNAVLTAAIGKRISSITITNGGSGYIPDAGTSITANTIAMYHP